MGVTLAARLVRLLRRAHELDGEAADAIKSTVASLNLEPATLAMEAASLARSFSSASGGAELFDTAMPDVDAVLAVNAARLGVECELARLAPMAGETKTGDAAADAVLKVVVRKVLVDDPRRFVGAVRRAATLVIEEATRALRL